MPNIESWIGIEDEGHEDVWQLSVDGTVSQYTNWMNGQPDNNPKSDCAVICLCYEAEKDGQWDDKPCTNTYSYLCQKPRLGKYVVL